MDSIINFVLIGVGGYIAPRHLAAIKAVGGNLLAALDKHDSVGILDSYFPECDFFTEFEIFERHINKLQHNGVKIHYVVVCSPNYLHDAHCRFGLRIGADVICEKPLCLNPENAIALQEMEQETGGRVWNILQLRLHPAIEKIKQFSNCTHNKIKLRYITARGKWYHHSWKGDETKSGGLCMNIGIHFFDMLIWLFGTPTSIDYLSQKDNKTIKGDFSNLTTEIEWLLSTDINLIVTGKRSERFLFINGEMIFFTEGFENLHIESYKEILAGRGFGVKDTLPALQLIHKINNF